MYGFLIFTVLLLHTWSKKSTQIRDTFISTVETAIELRINPLEYSRHRIADNAASSFSNT